MIKYLCPSKQNLIIFRHILTNVITTFQSYLLIEMLLKTHTLKELYK